MDMFGLLSGCAKAAHRFPSRLSIIIPEEQGRRKENPARPMRNMLMNSNHLITDKPFSGKYD
jgi:hypothetical protein